MPCLKPGIQGGDLLIIFLKNQQSLTKEEIKMNIFVLICDFA